MGTVPILFFPEADEEKQEAERVDKEKILEEKGKPDKGNKKRRGSSSAEERTQQVKAVADSVICLFFQKKMIGDDKQVAAQEAEQKKEDEVESLWRMCFQEYRGGKHDEHKPRLDDEHLARRNASLFFSERRADKEADHE